MHKIERENGKYYFQGREISRKQSQKMECGNWSDLTPEQIHRKLDNKNSRKATIEGYEIIYEELLKTSLGQYALGIAQEKVANTVTKFLKKIKNEGRRLVKANKTKIHQNMGQESNG